MYDSDGFVEVDLNDNNNWNSDTVSNGKLTMFNKIHNTIDILSEILNANNVIYLFRDVQ